MNKLWMVLAIMALVVVSAVATDQLQCIKANDRGEIVLDRSATVAGTILPPGTYTLHSEVKDGKHYVHFVEGSKQLEVHPETFEIDFSKHAAETQCTTEPGTTASTTAVFFTETPSGMQIQRVELQGEGHVHTF